MGIVKYEIMEAEIWDLEKDVGKVQFQQDLSKWFESRGVIANLRSHLRHLMITALQNTQVGAKPTDRSSPKAQAVNLMLAEYLFRHRCHYTLSVFASEVPTLANFNLDFVAQDGRVFEPSSKHPKLKLRFQENDVEEIFNALGLSAGVEELMLLKRRYLEKGSEVSLVELLLQTSVQMATKLQIHQKRESSGAEGETLLSKHWSSKIVDILSGAKVAPSQISSVEESIFRITETETRRAVEEERRLQVQILAEREKRIQEYFKKREDEIFFRLTEAEKDLIKRKEMIEEELTEREEHLTKMAFEWNGKHQEILRLSRKFHAIENENRRCKKKLKQMEEENKSLKSQEETQTRTIKELQDEMNSLINKLKEISESNSVLHERLQVLINRESGAVSADREGGNQKPVSPHQAGWNTVEPEKLVLSNCSTKGLVEGEFNCNSSEDEDGCHSSSLADIIRQVHEKLKVLEEESERLNQNYLEYKIKTISVDSDSDSQEFSSVESQQSIREVSFTKETKVCQTNVEGLFAKIQALKQGRKEKCDSSGFLLEKWKTSPTKLLVRTPTKRQLENRNFFLSRRNLLQELERLNTGSVQTSPSVVDDSDEESLRDLTRTSSKREHEPLVNPVITMEKGDEKTISTPLHKKPETDDKPSTDGIAKVSMENNNQMWRSEKDCLALLDEARRKSPQTSARKPLRQQMLLSESEKEEEKEEGNKRQKSSRIVLGSPQSNSSANVSFGIKTENGGFW